MSADESPRVFVVQPAQNPPASVTQRFDVEASDSRNQESQQHCHVAAA